MTFRVVQPPGRGKGHSPFRIVNENGREVAWVNRFLDQEHIRSVAHSTLRSYAHDLIHFLRWLTGVNQTDAITERALNKSSLPDCIRFQAHQHPQHPVVNLYPSDGTTSPT